jgi:1-acyl-sn-glycerol-3-phosphate acyltransferase
MSSLWDAARTLGCGLTVALLKAQFPLEVVGRPPELPRIVLAANHQSHLDAPVVLAALPEAQRRRATVLAARDRWFRSPMHALAASLLTRSCAFDRHDTAEPRRWLGRLRYQEDGCLVVFPSGSRHRAEPRPALLLAATRAGWSIVPVAISGTVHAWPPGSPFWRPGEPLRVAFGPALKASVAGDITRQLSSFWRNNVS